MKTRILSYAKNIWKSRLITAATAFILSSAILIATGCDIGKALGLGALSGVCAAVIASGLGLWLTSATGTDV